MSGLLADLYSAGDRMKRKLGGLLSDPMGTIALGSTRMAEDTNALTRLVSEAGYMPNTVNRADQSVLVSERQKALARALLADKATEMGANMVGATKFVYPQEQALLTAQRNAAKPISEGGLGLRPNNTPAERAAAMGMEDAYHGTNVAIKQIDKTQFGSATGANSAKQAWWAVDNPEVARGYAENAANNVPVKRLLQQADKAERVAQRTGNWDAYDDLVRRAEELEAANYKNPLNGQTIMPLSVRSGNAATMDAGGRAFVDTEQNINQFLRTAQRGGKDLAVINNLDDAAGRVDLPAKHFGIFNPSVIRSRFAAFDPMRRDSPDLLAGALPFTSMADEDTRNKLMQLLQRNGVPIK